MQGACVLLLLGLWLQLSLGLVPGNQEAPEAPHSQGAAPGSPDLHSPLGQLRRKTLPSGTARQPRPLMWLRSCSPSRQPPRMSSSSWGMVSALSWSTPCLPQSWNPGLPDDPGWPQGLRPDTVCTCRDGGFHGDSYSDPKGADGW